jgi:hypothetical protein
MRLTKTQCKYLTWLAEDPSRYMVAYGKQTKSVYALLDAGLIERRDGGRFYLTEGS